jgi:4-hydroxythreonine-4-phosphate dehydrogenase
MEVKKPVLAITMGDPAGIGPEIAVKSLQNKGVYEICKPLIIGDANAIKQAIEMVGAEMTVNAIFDVENAKYEYGLIDVYDLQNVVMEELVHGKVSAMAGNAAFEAIVKAIELAMEGKVDGTVTGPINKESINMAGHHFSGHTEIYAHYTKTKDYSMLLVDESLRVVHVTTHVSLRQACDLVKKERILRVIQLAHQAMIDFGIEKPRIGVAGLNPHASDGGLFGWEEEKEISPAVQEAVAMGINASGPISPDTLFSKAKGGEFDIAVAMYHDQGHIPLKVVGFNWDEAKQKWSSISGVNITLGLPIVRASVDHGTAFGKAGKGTATEESLLHAIEYGAKLSKKK